MADSEDRTRYEPENSARLTSESDETFVSIPGDEAQGNEQPDRTVEDSSQPASEVAQREDPDYDPTIVESGETPPADDATTATVISLPGEPTERPAANQDDWTVGDVTDAPVAKATDLSRTEATIVTGQDFSESPEDGTIADSGKPHDTDATFVSEAYSKSSEVPDDATSADEASYVEGDLDAPPAIDRFRLIRLLGRGAFGAVYLAQDPKLDRKVAVKVARTGVFDSKKEVEKFLREARSAAQLRHPNIVPVYEVGQGEQQSNFIVYEYIEGTSLKGLLKDEGGRLSHEHASRLTRQLAEALDYAHATGVVHRDIKPDNILIDTDGQPHIADFGLARRDEDITRTQDGAIMGTPAYMSPEQASGKGNVADGRTDIWSLGVMFNEMLTGDRPFKGTLTQVLLDVKEKEVRPLRQLDKRIPVDLDTICLKCLAKEPDERFAKAGLLAEELERWERGEPILSRRISVFARTGRWAKRNPLVASLIGTVCLTLFLGTLISTLFWLSAVSARRETMQADANAITTADPAQVAALVERFDNETDRREYVPVFRDRLNELQSESQSQDRLRYTLLRLDERKSLEEGLHAQLAESLTTRTDISAAETNLLVSVLPPDDKLRDQLWAIAEDANADKDRRFRATVALAKIDPDEELTWRSIAGDATSLLLRQLGEVDEWRKAISPVGQYYRPVLEQVMGESEGRERQRAAETLAGLLRDDVSGLVELVGLVEPAYLPDFIAALRRHSDSSVERLTQALKVAPPSEATVEAKFDHSQAIANSAVALLALGQFEPVIPLLQESHDEEIRTLIIHRAGDAGIDPSFFLTQLSDPFDEYVLIASLLALGEYRPQDFTPSMRAEIEPTLVRIFQKAPHPGVHSAADWLMHKWGQTEALNSANDELAAVPGPRTDRKWFVENGMTFVVVDGPVEYVMGSEYDPEEYQFEQPQKWRIPRSFAVSTREVTIGDFYKVISMAYAVTVSESIGAEAYQLASLPVRLRAAMLLPKNLQAYGRGKTSYGTIGDYAQRLSRDGTIDPDIAMTQVSWLAAAKYCRLLSEQVGIRPDENCYPPIAGLVRSYRRDRSQPDPDQLDKTGYRLLTAAEWEYIARTGTKTLRHFGDSVGNDAEVLSKYAWFKDNSNDAIQRVGLLKPNSFGLFDVHGNVAEWCQNWGFFQDKLNPAKGHLAEINGAWIDGTVRVKGFLREFRGGSYRMKREEIRSAYRGTQGDDITGLKQDSVQFDVGFRLARTLRSE